MPHPKAEKAALTVAHRTLTEQVRVVKTTIVGMLEEGSRDYEVLQDLLNEYVSLQYGADLVSGQAK